MPYPPCKILTFILSFTILTVSAQEPPSKPDVQAALEKYFEPARESVFLHLNKDLYVPGETLWFSGYIYNGKAGRPLLETSNLYVSLYNEQGELLTKKLFYCQGGYTKGQLPIDSLYESGAYFIKASTNWMRNFKEDLSYTQQLRIVSDTLVAQTPDPLKYDLQFLPEGGNLLTGVRNTIGVKATNSLGYGTPIKEALIVDEQGSQITNFTTNSNGLGKFELYPHQDKSYKALLRFPDGTQAVFPLPQASRRGLALSLKSNPRTGQLTFELFANGDLPADPDRGNYTLYIHNKKLYSEHPLEFDNNSNKASLLFQTEKLNPGMNIFTVFSPDNKPVAERLFFNYNGLEFPELRILAGSASTDSLDLKIKSSISRDYKLSVSVLPPETLAYGHDNTIYSQFYLQPYVKGMVENAGDYFRNITVRKQYEMDLLLLTQGWSKYNWDNVYKGPPELGFPFDNGLQLLGSLNGVNTEAGSKIVLHASENHGMQLLELDEEKSSFMITEFFPQNGEKIYLSLMDRKGKMTKPGTYLRILEQTESNSFSPPESRPFIDRTFQEAAGNPILTPPEFAENTIFLDEVTVGTERFRKKVKENIFIPPYLWNKVEEVDQDFAIKFPLVTDLIRMRGYDIKVSVGGGDLLDVRSYRGGGLALILDGVRQPSLNVLYNLPMTQIESFYFDKLSRREGIFSNGREVLYLYTRRGKELTFTTGSGVKKNAFEFLVEGGFEPAKTYYSPKYPTYSDRSYQAFGIVHWEAELSLDQKGEGGFKMVRTPIPEIRVYIEGMAPDGGLISGSQLVRIPTVMLD
ncbi:hypothetical protein [Robiginitalea sp. IMCC43444]|uniref:hypothetical protein n=1 Tax=Robiginitalea sp. IMCC43444 TaxID=3459121 RepID=UPI0040428F1E